MSGRRRNRNTSTFATRDIGDDGKFRKKCGCVMHTDWSQSELFAVYNIVKSKKFSMAIIKKMCKDGLITSRTVLLCSACYSHFKDM